MQLPEETLMHLATGSSLCIMVFTSASSTLSHHLKGTVQWSIFGKLILSIGIGVALGSIVASHISTHWLEVIFGIFLLAISLKILLDWKPEPKGDGSEFATPGLWL